VRAERANSMAMRVAGIEEGEGGKAMVIATRVAGKGMVTMMTRAIVTKTKEAGEEGNSKGGKSDGDGKDAGNGKQQRQQP
jgi:hypothetical protein